MFLSVDAIPPYFVGNWEFTVLLKYFFIVQYKINNSELIFFISHIFSQGNVIILICIKKKKKVWIFVLRREHLKVLSECIFY